MAILPVVLSAAYAGLYGSSKSCGATFDAPQAVSAAVGKYVNTPLVFLEARAASGDTVG